MSGVRTVIPLGANEARFLNGGEPDRSEMSRPDLHANLGYIVHATENDAPIYAYIINRRSRTEAE